MKKKSALTLIELLIGALILALVMLSVYLAFNTSVSGYRNIQEAIDIYRAARYVLKIIESDLRNSFSYSKDEIKFRGNNTGLSFLTLTDTYTNEGIMTRDYSFVSYKLDGDKLLRLCRRNKDALNDKSDIMPEEVISHIKEIIFKYGYSKGLDNPIEWQELWDKKEELPVAVEISLTLEGKTKESFKRTVFFPI